jgi:hypothetical protein
LKKDRYEPFELAHVGSIIPALRDGIEFVEQQYAIHALGVVQYVAYIGAGPPEKAAHNGRKIKRQEGAVQLAGNPASCQGLPHSRRAGKYDGTGW